MRVKTLFAAVSRPAKINVAWSRISSSKHAKLFFYVSLAYALLQIAFQLGGFANNRTTAAAFKGVVFDSRIVPKPFTILESNGDLSVCRDIPLRFGGSDPCEMLTFEPKKRSLQPTRKHQIASRGFTVQPVFDANGGITEIDLIGLDHANTVTSITSRCAEVFPWVFEVIHDASREDLVFVLYHFWLFGVSVTAILNDSNPHIAAALLSEFLATIWAAYRVFRTHKFERDFKRIVTIGSCDGIDVLPHFFSYRKGIEVPILVFSVLAFFILGFLSWRLAKEYHPRMYKRVESRPDMLRQYKIILSILTTMQISAFFVMAVSGLFIDELVLGPIRKVAEHRLVYEISFIFVVALTGPWLILGWFGVRKESRRSTIAFLILTMLFIAAWATMFSSRIYRYMFYTWDFYATMSIFTCLLLVLVVILSSYAFLNSGFGLPEYLKSEETHDPADRLAWTIESGKGSEDGKKDALIFLEEISEPLPVYKKDENVWNKPSNVAAPPAFVSDRQAKRQDERGSTATTTSLSTQPGDKVLPKLSPRQMIAQPITTTRTIQPPEVSDSARRAESRVQAKVPPGLSLAPPKPAPRPLISRRQIDPVNKSRWSATTTTTEIPAVEIPTTPATASAVGGRASGDASRSSRRAIVAVSTWSESTTTSSAPSEVPPPPMPALPRIASTGSEKGRNGNGTTPRNSA